MNESELAVERLVDSVNSLPASQRAEVMTLLDEIEQLTEGRNSLTICLAIGLYQCRVLQREKMRQQAENNRYDIRNKRPSKDRRKRAKIIR